LRRLISILLLAVFGLPLISPLLAFGADGGTGLPACCRRTGKHQCAMNAGERDQVAAQPGPELAQQGPEFRPPVEKCPYSPASVTAAHRDIHAGSRAELGSAVWLSQASGEAQTESMWRIARDRARGKRGPPSAPAHVA
jgi:hypothetical protein